MAPKILITGGTGYVGGRLIPLLDEHGGELELRLMARKPEYLRARVGDGIEIVSGDVTQPKSLATVLDGIDTAYYLIHSMGSGGDFEHQDRDAARNFAIAAKCVAACLLFVTPKISSSAGGNSTSTPHQRSVGS